MQADGDGEAQHQPEQGLAVGLTGDLPMMAVMYPMMKAAMLLTVLNASVSRVGYLGYGEQRMGH
jgi:hypothetical protein